MKKVIIKIYLSMLMLCTINQCMAQTENASPIDNLPPYITSLTTFGQRADWSHDGKKILFIEKTFGDVYEVELETKRIRPMTHHYFHEGYTRALYLSNGDILLSGARQFNSADPWPSRSEENAELWILKHDLSGAPIPLGEKCSEGPAVSRTRMRIAWTQKNKIYLGDIATETGTYHLIGKRLILDAADLDFKCNLETQNFRPPEEKEIIFSAYDYQGGEVMGVNIETGEIRNYSNADNQYDEPEGIFPDGKYTLVESDRHVSKGKKFKGIQYIDIHKLALDGSGKYERITNFTDYSGWKATNPVVSDDGCFIAFQYAEYGDPAGVGRGILLFDIRMYEKMMKK
jgi:Tol biopolymer transport system component